MSNTTAGWKSAAAAMPAAANNASASAAPRTRLLMFDPRCEAPSPPRPDAHGGGCMPIYGKPRVVPSGARQSQRMADGHGDDDDGSTAEVAGGRAVGDPAGLDARHPGHRGAPRPPRCRGDLPEKQLLLAWPAHGAGPHPRLRAQRTTA